MCPALHMPMRVRRTGAPGHAPLIPLRALPVHPRQRAHGIPHAAITTDLIVGFPVRPSKTSRRRSTWWRGPVQRSVHVPVLRRPGTPAAGLDGQLPKAVVQERYERLIEPTGTDLAEENTAQIGRTVELLVAVEKDAKTPAPPDVWAGRDGRLRTSPRWALTSGRVTSSPPP